MIVDSKPRRKHAGFIRTASHRALPTFNRQQITIKDQSSDQFSSFQNCEKVKQDSESEFSPYKFSINMAQPPLPYQHKNPRYRGSVEKNESSRNKPGTLRNSSKRQSVPKKDEREEQLKNILRKRAEVEKELAEIDKICHKINKIQSPFQSNEKTKQIERKSHQIQATFNVEYSDDEISFEEENSGRNPERFQALQKRSQNQEQKVHLQPQRHVQQNIKNQVVLHKGNQYQFSESSVSEADEYTETETFGYQKNIVINRRNSQEDLSSEERVKIEHDRARDNFFQKNKYESEEENEESQGEELIQQYGGNQFKKTIKECVQQMSPEKDSRHLQPRYNSSTRQPNKIYQYQKTNEQLNTLNIQSPGFHKTKGGICFNLDINEFTHNEIPTKPNVVRHQPTKPKKKNPKQQILKRRQMARNYDKQARMRVFGGY